MLCSGWSEDLYDGEVWQSKVLQEGFGAKGFVLSLCPDGVRFKKKSSMYFVLTMIWNLPPWLRNKRMFLLPLLILPEHSKDHQQYYSVLYEQLDTFR